MKRETRLKQLVAQLPAKQQTLEFDSDRLWQQLPRGDQQVCCKAIASLLFRVVLNRSESNDEANNNTEENDENE